jgi:hypothetical protein
MSSALGTIERKLTTFRNDPVGVLKRRALFAWQETARRYAMNQFTFYNTAEASIRRVYFSPMGGHSPEGQARCRA